MMDTKLSIIIPVLNEQESIEILSREIKKVLQDNQLYDYEIIYIDDGSSDRTFENISDLGNNDSKIKAVRLRKNFGKANALAVGFKLAQGNLIITMDGDLQDDPKEIPNLIKAIEKQKLDLVSGWKQNRQDNWFKKLSSKLFNHTISRLSGLKLHDYNCGLKIYRQEVIKNIQVYGELHRFTPLLALEKGFRIGEITVNHRSREFGSSKYGKLGLKRLRNYLIDPLATILITKYINKPAHFFGGLGLVSFTVGFLICLYLSLIWIFTPQSIGSRPLLFLGILLIITGIQLISMGFLGELIRRKYSLDIDIYIKDVKNIHQPR